MPIPLLAAILPALGAIGSGIASGAGAAGSALASGASAVGSGLASGASALGSGIAKGAGLAGKAAGAESSSGGLVNSLLGQAGSGIGNLGEAAIPQIGKGLVSSLLTNNTPPGMMAPPQIQAPGINTNFSENRLNRRFM